MKRKGPGTKEEVAKRPVRKFSGKNKTTKTLEERILECEMADTTQRGVFVRDFHMMNKKIEQSHKDAVRQSGIEYKAKILATSKLLLEHDSEMAKLVAEFFIKLHNEDATIYNKFVDEVTKKHNRLVIRIKVLELGIIILGVSILLTHLLWILK